MRQPVSVVQQLLPMHLSPSFGQTTLTRREHARDQLKGIDADQSNVTTDPFNR